MNHDIDYLTTNLHPVIESKLIVLLLAGIGYSAQAAWFLSLYYRLHRKEKQANGMIVSFDQGGPPFLRPIIVPVVRFTTEEGFAVEGIPEYSSFTWLNGFSRQQPVSVCYQADKPGKFVIISPAEVEANWAMIIGFVGLVLVGLWIYRVTW